uniref:Transposase Tc1-like domain-containing protein n=1 Tax=Esox lucius TaxID=8010 RepID=A0AAY5KGQ8_ESOLU
MTLNLSCSMVAKTIQRLNRIGSTEDKQTKDMDYWKHVLWSNETKINLFGSDGVKRVLQQPGEEYKTSVLSTVKHGGGSVMVWGCISAAGTGELQFIEGTMNANMYCDILKQSMIPSLRRLGRRAETHFQDNHCLAKEAEGKGDGLTKHVSRPKPYCASVGHPQPEGGGAQGL